MNFVRLENQTITMTFVSTVPNLLISRPPCLLLILAGTFSLCHWTVNKKENPTKPEYTDLYFDLAGNQ